MKYNLYNKYTYKSYIYIKVYSIFFGINAEIGDKLIELSVKALLLKFISI